MLGFIASGSSQESRRERDAPASGVDVPKDSGLRGRLGVTIPTPASPMVVSETICVTLLPPHRQHTRGARIDSPTVAREAERQTFGVHAAPGRVASSVAEQLGLGRVECGAR